MIISFGLAIYTTSSTLVFLYYIELDSEEQVRQQLQNLINQQVWTSESTMTILVYFSRYEQISHNSCEPRFVLIWLEITQIDVYNIS